jgi:hypothetical protein
MNLKSWLLSIEEETSRRSERGDLVLGFRKPHTGIYTVVLNGKTLPLQHLRKARVDAD